ncbi:hypothetical protein GYA44_03030 [Candidatus Microgenomates bacterium]|nr:hypothetical protein [Candidatus Microgenomates bacterium]
MKLKLDINIKKALGYLLLTVITSLLITSILIALPLTEKLSSKTNFNLNTKNGSYWSKEYFVKVESTNNKDIEKTRDIIFKRLDSFGVEEVSIYKENPSESSTNLRIVVNSTKNEGLVSQLIKNRFQIAVLTKKDEVDFENTEDQYAYLMPSSYNETGWEANDFRNIYITKLKTNSGEYAHFAIFKLWPWKENSFREFLKNNSGKYIGVYTDGYVSPYQVPSDNSSNTMLAIPVNTEDAEQIKAISLLYNAGEIPADISLESENALTPQIQSIDHIKISIGLAISLVVVYLYLAIFKHSPKEILLKSFVATIFTISFYLAGLKLLSIPIDTFLLPVIAILTMILVRIISENKDSEIQIEVALLFILLLASVFGYGYLPIAANHLIVLVVLSKIMVLFSSWYIHKVRNI